ncbi:MAG: acetyl-CoA carboxylase biotin carboxyl carrier protein subunit [Campylobacteraceae bacterium]|nr:acetyl-CoA carboxylase biotin carboxyl carrier protein subunit [Campylobacteraceae bacterium]
MICEVLTMTPGNMWKVEVKVGDKVQDGDLLFIMEVMKTEVNHVAEINGTVTEVNIIPGEEDLEAGFIAMKIEE